MLASVFWDRRRVLLVDFLHEHRIINATHYCGLDQVRLQYPRKRRDRLIREVLLLHDNAAETDGNALGSAWSSTLQPGLNAMLFPRLVRPFYENGTKKATKTFRKMYNETRRLCRKIICRNVDDSYKINFTAIITLIRPHTTHTIWFCERVSSVEVDDLLGRELSSTGWRPILNPVNLSEYCVRYRTSYFYACFKSWNVSSVSRKIFCCIVTPTNQQWWNTLHSCYNNTSKRNVNNRKAPVTR